MSGVVVAYRVDDGLRRLYTSPSALRLVDLPPEDFDGSETGDALETVLPSDRDRVMRDIREGLVSGEDFDSYYRVFRGDAAWVWVHARVHAMGSMDGDPVILCVLIDDTSENGNIAELIEHSENAIYVIDGETYEILYMNRSCRNLFGDARLELGQTCFSYMHGNDEPCPQCLLKHTQDDSLHLDELFQERTRTWHQYDYHRITWLGRQAWAVYAHDITQRRDEQARLRDTLVREEQLVNYIRMLSEPDAFQNRMDRLLAELGSNLHADRTYIFRAEGERTSVAYEWCAPGIAPAREDLQSIEGSFLYRWLSDFLEKRSSVIVTNVEDIQEKWPKEHMLMTSWGVTRYAEAPLLMDGELIGFVGVDNPDPDIINPAGDLLLSLAYYITGMIVNEREKQALKESKLRFQRAIDSTQLIAWDYDIRNHRITMLDSSATNRERKIFGWPEVIEDVPASLVQLISDEDVDTFLEMFREVDAGRDATCEVWYKQVEGLEPRCERISYVILRDEEGRPVMAQGIGRNITAEKRVEERYENEMRLLQEDNDYGLIAKGHYNLTQNRILAYDTFDERFLSFEPEGSYDEAVRTFLSLPYSQDIRERLADTLNRENLIRRYKNGTLQASIVYPKRVVGQAPIWVSLIVHTDMMPSSGDIECFTYAYDITAKRQSEIVMDLITGADVEYIGLIFPHIDAFEFLSKVARIRYPEIGQRVSYEGCRAYVRGNFIDEDEVAEFDRATSPERILDSLRDHGSHVSTFRRTENGRTLCMQMSYRWFDEDSETILAIRTDVTTAFERDRRQLEEVEAARLAADRANEEKSDFLSSISHDIRTPLNAIIGFTDFALQSDEPDTARSYMEKVKSSADLLLALVNDVLDLSRIESGKMTIDDAPTPVEELGAAVAEALRPTAEGKGVTLISGPYPDGMVYVDKLKHQKIWLNLISNAIKYTPEGGVVEAFVECIDPPVDGHNRRLVVADTGIGMSEEFQRTMFEPFSQEKRSETTGVQGTGLGLAIVKRLVDLLGGTITVQSARGKGTRFEIEVDIPTIEKGEASRTEAKIRSGALADKRVLLCEDNDMNAEIASVILQSKGMSVDWARDGSQALDMYLASDIGHYDLILMDVRMPIMDGREATRVIRSSARPDASIIPIIALTADAFAEDVRENENAGMNAQITKPINPAKLFSVIEDALGD